MINIAPEIVEYADKLGLDTRMTGGGCDFVVRSFKDVDLVLCNSVYECPTTLEESAVVTVNLNDDEWTITVAFPFSTVREAMQFMESGYNEINP